MSSGSSVSGPVLITGAAGFVGRALIETLTAAGTKVIAADVQTHGILEHPHLTKVATDLRSSALRELIRDGRPQAIVHLATVPGGAAEADPALARRVNLDASLDLLDALKETTRPARLVFASSIAVFGRMDALRSVNDTTQLAPVMVYGAHKAMIELAICAASLRGEIDGISLRLPGVLARPRQPSGMKSAFLSDIFHALRASENFVSPVSPGATMWVQSVGRTVDNLLHALKIDASRLPVTRTVTLPALRVTMADFVAEISRQTGRDAGLVRYEPDPQLEALFGAQPSLDTPAASAAGFRRERSLSELVRLAIGNIEHTQDYAKSVVEIA